MNKDNIAFAIAMSTGTRRSVVETVLDAFYDLVKEEVNNEKKVSISGFGVFEAKHRNARIGRNPHTKEAVPIPERNVPFFKPAKAFKEMLCK